MLKKLSIKSKIVILVFIPIVVTLLLAYKLISQDYKIVNNLERLEIGVELSTKISALVHETQKERGATAGFLGSKGKKFKDKLANQRKLTDLRIRELNDFLKTKDLSDLSSEIYKLIESGKNQLSHIEKMRENISSLSIPAKKAISYYTKMNGTFLDVLPAVSKISHSPYVTKELIAYSNFLFSKERAGIERAVGANTLARDNFAKGMRQKFNHLIAQQNAFMDNFLKYASKDSKKFYIETLDSPYVKQVQEIRNTLLLSAYKYDIISKMKELVGYGGFIHNFKNYVLRGKEKYLIKSKKQYLKLMENIKEYKTLSNVSKKELALLNDVEKVFSTYYNNLEKLNTSVLEHESIKELDKIVKVSDGPAITALHRLGTSFFSVDAVYWFNTITKKINLLKKVDDHLANEILQSIEEEYYSFSFKFYSTLALVIFFVLFSIILSFIVIKEIISSLDKFKDGLLSFFSYVNREKSSTDLLEDNGKDEISQMAKVVNENIRKTQKEIEDEKVVINRTIEVLKQFEDGDLSPRIDVSTSNEVLEELTSLVDKVADSFEKNIGNVLRILDSYSSYDYTQRIDNDDLKDHLKQLSDGVNHLGTSISSMLVQNEKIGMQLHNSSKTLLENVDILNQSSTSAAASLEETAASIEEITSNIVNNSEVVNQMSSSTSVLSTVSQEGKDLANKTMSAMEEINKEVSSINEAISVIDQIAFQTNILSLNAAVEAATAGEAGKGFAVVAGEVRNLAARSAQAAKEIKDIVEKANIKAGEGKNIANSMIDGYEDLNKNISTTIELIKQVETSSKEQRIGIEQINDAISEQDKRTQEIANAANENYDIAVNTSTLSSQIVEETNEKKF